jgi:hypothetical protein
MVQRKNQNQDLRDLVDSKEKKPLYYSNWDKRFITHQTNCYIANRITI